MQAYQNFVNGKFAASSGEDRIEVKNPSTGQLICTVPESTAADVEAALIAAEAAQHVGDGIDLAYVAEKLVAEPLAPVRAPNQASRSTFPRRMTALKRSTM